MPRARRAPAPPRPPSIFEPVHPPFGFRPNPSDSLPPRGEGRGGGPRALPGTPVNLSETESAKTAPASLSESGIGKNHPSANRSLSGSGSPCTIRCSICAAIALKVMPLPPKPITA